MSKQEFSAKNFRGCVYLKEGVWHTNGKHYHLVQGFVSVLPNIELAGFDADNKSANFCARVAEKEDGSGEAMIVFGCQIRMISALVEFPNQVSDGTLQVSKL